MSSFNRRKFFQISTIGGLALSMPIDLKSAPSKEKKILLDPYQSSVGRFSHSYLRKIANKYGSPTYLYDWDLIKTRYLEFRDGFKKHYPKVKVHYAYKANTNLNIISYLTSLGAGAECISIGEMSFALKAGQKGENIIFTSNSKSEQELRFAIKNKVLINIDSLSGLKNLESLVGKLKTTVRVCFRINPDVETTSTHKHISTGHKFTKFGLMYLNEDIYKAAKIAIDNKFMTFEGIHSHIGSQILESKPFEKNAQILSSVSLEIKKRFNYEISFINMGGGLGIPYRDNQARFSPERLASIVCPILKRKFSGFKNLPEIWLEPGRYLVAEAGVLLSKVNSVKMTDIKNFINVDTGFNHLARPIMYEAYHRVRILNGKSKTKKFQVAGNICETGDMLTKDRLLPKPEVGDIIALLDSGAYGFSMASEYNSFYLPAEVAIKGNSDYLIRKREDFNDLLRNQILEKKLI